MTKSGARTRSIRGRGEAASSISRSVSSRPYSRSRKARRYGEVFSRKVTSEEMPTMSTPAAHSSGWKVSPASTM